MKKLLLVLMSFGLCLTLIGCSKNEVKQLMEEENYEEAYKLIENDIDKYSEYKDECRYYLGLNAMKEKQFVDASEYFEENSFNDSDKKYDECRYNVAVMNIENKEFKTARLNLKDNSYKDSEELLSSIISETKNYYTLATTITKKDLSKNKLGLYSYGDIDFTSDDSDWIDSVLNKEGTVNQGAFYRKMAMLLEGYRRGFNDGSNYSEHLLGFSTTNKEEFKPYVDELSTYIVEENILKSVMSKFSTLNSVIGKFDIDADSYEFTINDLTACAKELKISEEMLGYILAMLDEYAPTVSFGVNSYTYKSRMNPIKEPKDDEKTDNSEDGGTVVGGGSFYGNHNW